MLALAMISLPLSASALEVRVDENAAPVVKVFQGKNASFEYDDGDVISQQTIRGKNGDVDQLLIQFVDPQSGERINHAFVALQFYRQAPAVEGVDDAQEAIAQNFIAQLSRSLGQRVHTSKVSDELPNVGRVEGYQAQIDSKDGAHYVRFFVTSTANGHALILEQRDLNDKDAQKAVERLLESLSFGGKG